MRDVEQEQAEELYEDLSRLLRELEERQESDSSNMTVREEEFFEEKTHWTRVCYHYCY